MQVNSKQKKIVPTDLNNILQMKREQILQLACQYGAYNIRIFGSVARGEWTPHSDLDLLVDMQEGRNLLDLIGFEQDLEDLLGVKVDTLTEAGISPYLRVAIIQDSVPL